ncbi:hypothetical protein COF09_22740 [Bacillus toyonensis]|uniref:insecticidal delta-endotoxin Cry8Ea1 family protein n=1 Tax=Bacillus toyonensis TaxID=155322 RepID=UPI0009AAEB90|nr:insecticidal delta-endotoxin Cry8Ea1 family protein [Bacillus toyonensis]PHC39085.1 hypothetical protein COF09_22740 [Bacillus toyonensis]
MKYKNRKHAKRKYKQTLLATVPTMTSGVDTLGSTSSAFAEEKATEAQQAAMDSLGVGGGASTDDAFKAAGEALKEVAKLKKDGKNKFTQEAQDTITLLGKAAPIMYADAHASRESFNNTLRTLSLGVLDYFPYGKIAISPILGLLWPEIGNKNKNQFDSLMKDMKILVKEGIETYDLSGLKQNIISLKTQMQTFEKLVNSNTLTEGLYSAGSDEESARTAAQILQDTFHNLINDCQKDNLDTAELPKYTTIATIHLLFLNYMEKNWSSPQLQYPKSTFDKIFADDIKNAAQTYMDYIQKTYTSGNSQFVSKLKDVVGYESSFPQQTQRDLFKKYSDLSKTVAAMESGKDNTHTPAVSLHTMKERLNEAEKNYNDYKNLVTIQDNYYNNTIGNKAFDGILRAVLGTWKKAENGKWIFVDSAGHKKIDWLHFTTTYFYLAPSGGTENSDHVKFTEGEMVTDWVKIRAQWYYFSPSEGTKNSGQKKFAEGEMMTGWVEIADKKPNDRPGERTGTKHWYYLNPENGSMIQDKKEVQIDEKKYDFDSNGVCITPKGY